jgi:hypothetical protein
MILILIFAKSFTSLKYNLISFIGIKTLFAGSSCNDLVTLDSQSVISGHIDKKIRFWDVRADPPQSEILLQGKITSLDLSSSKKSIFIILLIFS